MKRLLVGVGQLALAGVLALMCYLDITTQSYFLAGWLAALVLPNFSLGFINILRSY